MSARRPLARFWRDKRGVSAVEFALIAPVLIVMYCGLAEMTQAMMAQRRLSNIASQIGDLVAQSSQTGPNSMTDVFKIGTIIMAPFPSAPLKMCVASVTSDATGRDTVAWSRASAGGMSNCPTQGAVLTDVPVGVLPASKSVIMARASYAYAAPITLVLPSSITFQRTFYLRPRKVETIPWSTSN